MGYAGGSTFFFKFSQRFHRYLIQTNSRFFSSTFLRPFVPFDRFFCVLQFIERLPGRVSIPSVFSVIDVLQLFRIFRFSLVFFFLINGVRYIFFRSVKLSFSGGLWGNGQLHVLLFDKSILFCCTWNDYCVIKPCRVTLYWPSFFSWKSFDFQLMRGNLF